MTNRCLWPWHPGVGPMVKNRARLTPPPPHWLINLISGIPIKRVLSFGKRLLTFNLIEQVYGGKYACKTWVMKDNRRQDEKTAEFTLIVASRPSFVNVPIFQIGKVGKSNVLPSLCPPVHFRQPSDSAIPYQSCLTPLIVDILRTLRNVILSSTTVNLTSLHPPDPTLTPLCHHLRGRDGDRPGDTTRNSCTNNSVVV